MMPAIEKDGPKEEPKEGPGEGANEGANGMQEGKKEETATENEQDSWKQAFPRGVYGLERLEAFMQHSDANGQQMIYEECTVILECKWCKQLFRELGEYADHSESCKERPAQADSQSPSTSSMLRPEDGPGSSASHSMPPPSLLKAPQSKAERRSPNKKLEESQKKTGRASSAKKEEEPMEEEEEEEGEDEEEESRRASRRKPLPTLKMADGSVKIYGSKNQRAIEDQFQYRAQLFSHPIVNDRGETFMVAPPHAHREEARDLAEMEVWNADTKKAKAFEKWKKAKMREEKRKEKEERRRRKNEKRKKDEEEEKEDDEEMMEEVEEESSEEENEENSSEEESDEEISSEDKKFSKEEIRIFGFFEKRDVRCADFLTLKCDHPSCSHLARFHSVEDMAHHCSLRHTMPFVDASGDNKWPCLLCERSMLSVEGVEQHLLRCHPKVKEEDLDQPGPSKSKEKRITSKSGRGRRSVRSPSNDTDQPGPSTRRSGRIRTRTRRLRSTSRDSIAAESVEVGEHATENVLADEPMEESAPVEPVVPNQPVKPALQADPMEPKEPITSGEEMSTEGTVAKRASISDSTSTKTVDHGAMDEQPTSSAGRPWKKSKKEEIVLSPSLPSTSQETGKAPASPVESAVEASVDSGSSRKRKQNLRKLADKTEELVIVPSAEETKSQLGSLNVFIHEKHMKLFFGDLTEKKDEDGTTSMWTCGHCNAKMTSENNARRHMVSHIRAARFKCRLCDAGAFYLIDMRQHLMQRGCPNLNEAPPGIVKPGLPAMTKENADTLTIVTHTSRPGQYTFISGKIVSVTSHVPHFPDPVIEEKMLGPYRTPSSSPQKTPHKMLAKKNEPGPSSAARALDLHSGMPDLSKEGTRPK